MQASAQEEILVVDSYSIIYRNYYALGGLTNSSGQPTNALYGMAKFLLRLEKEHPSAYGAFAFDLGRSTFRLAIEASYKANRPPMPDDLRAQLEPIRTLITAFGWTILEKEGIEADDIIAALAKDFPALPLKAVTSDKDIAQIVDKRVSLLVPDRKGGGFLLQGEDEVFQRFQVRASQVVDYLSLIGDSSDNIVGVEGVGPKTAVALLSEHGSIKNMLENPSAIKSEKLRAKISASGDVLNKNIRLITLMTEFPDKPWNNLENIVKKQPDWLKIRETASAMELKSVIAELDKLTLSEKPSQKHENSSYTPDLFGSF